MAIEPDIKTPGRPRPRAAEVAIGDRAPAKAGDPAGLTNAKGKAVRARAGGTSAGKPVSGKPVSGKSISGKSAKGDPGDGTSLENSHKVLVALRRIIRATDLHSKQLFKKSGLTIPQVIVLQSIRDLGEVTTGQVSRRVSLSQGTVTSILDRLENNELIERYRSVADRRVVHASLTKKGRAVLRKAPPLLHERFVDAFGALSGSGQDEIVRVLEEVAEMMGADGLDAAPLLDIAPPPGLASNPDLVPAPGLAPVPGTGRDRDL